MAVLALAAALRFAGIGQWSFASDELGTFWEVGLFLDPSAAPPDNPDANVPKMIPLAMLIHRVGHLCFGTNEAGCRTMMALFGVGQILLCGLGLPGLVGRSATLGCVLLLALSPEHLFYSQYHRFYMPAAFFATAAFLAAARAARTDSVAWMLTAVVAAGAAVLTHTFLGLVFIGLVGGAALGRVGVRGRPFGRAFAVALGGAMIVAVFAAVYLYPLGKGKATEYPWAGFSPAHAVFSSISQLSWPVALFIGPGGLLLRSKDRAAAWFWGVQAAVWCGAVVALPLMLPFHSAYVFPLNLPMFVLAGCAMSGIVDRLSAANTWGARAMFVAIPLLNVPSVVSHYQDGSRHDFRAASQWIAEHIGTDDFVVAVQADKLEFYQPTLHGRWDRPPSRDIPEWIARHRSRNGVTWIVIPGGRGGLPAPWAEWCDRDVRVRATILHRRFDYHEYPIFILEWTGAALPPALE